MEKLVTIATFDFPAQAEMQKLLLEKEGVHAFLANDNLTGMNWLLSNATGGAQLQVSASDAERARQILQQHEASRTQSAEKLPKGDVTFACETCGEQITFPGQRRGHVETCPTCGNYVDVPEDAEGSLLKAPETKPSESAPSSEKATQQNETELNPRATSLLWMEVLAVLCLAYVPYMFGILAVSNGWASYSTSFVFRELDWIVTALRVSLPVLVFMALATEPWSSFGIVRPRWIADILLGCAIWLGNLAVYYFVTCPPTPSMLDAYATVQLTHGHGLARISAHVLFLVACVASASCEELVMRGYLITRFERLFRSTSAAVLVSSALFASYHLYQGIHGVIGAAITGLVYATAFCSVRRLWPVCVAHALHNYTIYLWTANY